MGRSEKVKDKLRVLFIIPSLSRAGAETQVVDLLNSLDNNRFNIYLFTFHKNIDLYQKLNHEKIKFYNKPRKYKLDFSIIKNIVRIVDKEKIDIIHCSGFIALLMGWLTEKLSKNSPLIFVAIHTTKHRSIKDEIYEKVIYQWLLRACDHVIFVSKKQAEHWRAKYPFLTFKSDVIYNGVDTSYFNPSFFQFKEKKFRRSLSIPNGAPVLCCIAGFRKEKGHDDLIEAFASLGENVYLLLAGDGERKDHIELIVKKKGLKDRVKFLGNVSDVRPILAVSNISVLASTAVETFSIAMLESMSMGIPVVATNVGGLSEAIIPGETGDLTLPGDPKMLAEKLSNLLNQVKLEKMRKSCREIVIQNFSKEGMVSATERSLLKHLIKSNRN